jgi:predicted ATPase
MTALLRIDFETRTVRRFETRRPGGRVHCTQEAVMFSRTDPEYDHAELCRQLNVMILGDLPVMATFDKDHIPAGAT